MSTLQAKQLAETRFQANNNRRQYIALTAEGLRMHDEIVQIAQARERQLVSELTDEERTTLVRLLTRMSAQIPNLSDEADKLAASVGRVEFVAQMPEPLMRRDQTFHHAAPV